MGRVYLSLAVSALLLTGCGEECESISKQIASVLSRTQTCDANSGCAYQVLNCGLPACGAIVSKSNQDDLMPLLNEWDAHSCRNSSKCTPCPEPISADPVCSTTGVCPTL